jgi:4-amino-4-deoxy-L-arabinose transferase-like glycosyltransferase
MSSFLTRNLKGATVVLAVYFLLNVALRMALPHSLELDEAEQAFFSQYLLPGYGPQPPFYNWMQYVVISVTGMSMWALTVPKNLLLFLSYLFYGLAAREVLKERSLAALAMLSLITLPQVAFMAQRDLTHTVTLLLATSLFLLGFLRTLNRPGIGSYLLIGIATGIGIISKYNFALMPAAALLAVLPDIEWRRRALDLRMLLAIAVAAAIILPHGLWLLNNMDQASAGTLSKMIENDHEGRLAKLGVGLLSLLVAIVAFTALPAVLFAAAFRADLLRALRAGNRWTRMLERMMIISLIAVAIITVGVGATHIRERWLTPFLLVLPLYTFMKLEATGIDLSAGHRRFRQVIPVLMAIVLLSLGLRVVAAQWIGSYSKPNIPFPSFAREMTAKTKPALVIASDMYVAGNLRVQLPDVPIVVPGSAGSLAALSAASQGPVLVVWRGATESDATTIPQGLTLTLSAENLVIVDQRMLLLPYYYGRDSDKYALGYAWVRSGG